MATILRTAVSRKKRRYVKDGYDLDLAYITDRIIAMGFPSEGTEGIYRNPYEDVIKFLDDKHMDHYKVYNLCSERDYPTTHFYGRVGRFPFDDHNAPPFDLLEIMCKDVKQYLDEHEKNVVVIHCKAGKGRTGVLICCSLLYSRVWNSAADALDYYGAMRTYNKKGVTIPSQRRYVGLFAEYLRYGVGEPQSLLVKEFVMHNPPKFMGDLEYIRLSLKGPCPERKLFTTLKFTPKEWFKMLKTKNDDEKKSMLLEGLKIDIGGFPMTGDIKVEIMEKERGLGTSEKLLFSLWVNTYFIEPSKPVVIPKEGLDKGLKDKRLDDNFHVSIGFEPDPNAKTGRRRSILSQLLNTRSVTMRGMKVKQQIEFDQEDGRSDEPRRGQAHLDRFADQIETASVQGQVPPAPTAIIVERFPSLERL